MIVVMMCNVPLIITILQSTGLKTVLLRARKMTCTQYCGRLNQLLRRHVRKLEKSTPLQLVLLPHLWEAQHASVVEIQMVCIPPLF
jgi:hypothetical protein